MEVISVSTESKEEDHAVVEEEEEEEMVEVEEEEEEEEEEALMSVEEEEETLAEFANMATLSAKRSWMPCSSRSRSALLKP